MSTLNLNFYFALFALLVSIGNGVYFFIRWLNTKRQHLFLLYLSGGLASLVLFKVPNIIANAGYQISQQDFYSFFFITLLIYLLGVFSLIHAVRLMNNQGRISGRTFFFTLWFVVAIFYLGANFFIKGLSMAYPLWVAHLIFFIPAGLILLYELYRLFFAVKRFTMPKTSFMATTLATILLVTTSILYIIILMRPNSDIFWYVFVVSSTSVSFIQLIIGILLFFGFRSLAKARLKTF